MKKYPEIVVQRGSIIQPAVFPVYHRIHIRHAKDHCLNLCIRKNQFVAECKVFIKIFFQLLQEQGVYYADLLSLFRNDNEVLYLKRDSHWNGKGALAAYNCIMDTLEYAHKNYEDAPVTRSKHQ